MPELTCRAFLGLVQALAPASMAQERVPVPARVKSVSVPEQGSPPADVAPEEALVSH
jgi:hypothetical protein